MPKKTKTTETQDTNGAPPPDLPKEPTLTGPALKKAFAEYDSVETKVEKARAALESALNERSIIVERIAKEAGKGPFSYKGTVLTPTSRTTKATGQRRWFFKGPGRNDLVEVD